MEIQIQKLKCKRCGHEWVARKPNVRVCPKCKSPYWDKDKKICLKKGSSKILSIKKG